MDSQTGSFNPTPSTSSVSQLQSNVPIPSPTLIFTNVPDELFTCTSQLVTWNSTGIFSDPNSDTNDSIEDIYPFSVLTIGITGLYVSSVPGSVTERLSLSLTIDDIFDTQHQNNVSFTPVDTPPGLYTFTAGLIVNTKASTSAILHPIAAYSFSSLSFLVLNGTTTDCVIHPVQPIPSPSSSQTSVPGQELSSTSKHLNGGAIAGITIGSIIAALLFFLIIAFLRLRFTRSHPASQTFGRMSIPGVLKPSTRREKRDTADFIGLESFDSSHVPAHDAKERQV